MPHFASAAAHSLVAWGDNQYGQCDIPPGLTNVAAVAGGELHSLALLRDGQVIGWGAGTNNTGAYPHHGQACPPAGLTNVVAIAARGEHSLALQRDGSVVAWGWNHYGQGSVPAGLTNLMAVSAGVIHNLALRADGTVFAWGHNDHGQCDVPEGLSNVVAIAAGYRHSVALKGDGRVVAWGGADYDYDLTQIPSGLENVVAIAAGDYHTLTLRADGTVVAWGDSWNSAAAVPEGLNQVVAIAAGSQHSVALLADGSLAGWGNNYYHQTNMPSPLLGVAAITCGQNHSLALAGAGAPFLSSQPISRSVFDRRTVNFYAQASGQLPLEYQWFFNGEPIAGATNHVLTLATVSLSDAGDYRLQVSNALGVATSESASLSVVDSAPWLITQPESRKVIVGQSACFWVLADGSGPLRFQWQHDEADIPGATNRILLFDPVQTAQAGQYSVAVSNTSGSVTSINVFLEVSQVASWGDYYTPPISGLTNIVALAAGWYHCLALKEDGTVIAWGGNDPGQSNVPSGLTNVIAIAAGSCHSLALRDDGTVAAWGDPWSPAQAVPSGLTNVVAISAGGYVSLALKADGTVTAWGDNQYGQLQVPSSATNIIALHTFGGHCLAVRGDHTVVAWGNNDYGQSTVPPGLRNVVAVAANGIFSLALKADGLLSGWGCGESWSHTTIPLAATNLVAISGGGSPHYLVLRQDGRALAWGYDEFGANLVPDGLPDLAQVSAGGFYNLALAANTAPFLVAPPLGRQVLAGGDVTFHAQATGALPLSYQWHFNDAPLAGATNAWLNRPAVTTNEAGYYTLVVSNALGTTISSPARLGVTPLDGAPLILLEPEDQLGWPSAGASFRVLAGGAPPLFFQWLFNGTNLPGATNSTLDLVDLSVADSGYYRVRISNHFGATHSTPAFLGVLDYSAALNSTGLVFGTSLDPLWEVDPWITHDGALAARAGGRIGHPASRLQTSVTGPGYVTFWWKANPLGRDFVFRMDDDGVPVYYSAGEWQTCPPVSISWLGGVKARLGWIRSSLCQALICRP